MPRPAGVIAPVRVMPTVTSGSSIRWVNSWHPSRKPARVVGQERVVDQLGHRLFAGGSLGIDALAAQVWC